MEKKRPSIHQRILLFQFISIILIMFAYGLISYRTNYSREVRLMAEETGRVAQRLSLQLPYPFWNLDRTSVHNMLEQEVKNPYLSGIAVFQRGTVWAGLWVEATGEIHAIDTVDSQLDPGVTASREKIVYKDEKGKAWELGELVLYTTDKTIKASLRSLLSKTALQTLLLIITLSISITVILNLLLRNPLRRITSTAQRIGDGEIELQAEVSGTREIATLANTFNTMTRRLRESINELEMFRYTIDHAPDGVFWMDREGRFTYVNEQACHSLGYSREELEKLYLWDIDPVYPKEDHFEDWNKFLKGSPTKNQQVETLHKRKDGTIFPIDVMSRQMWFGDTPLHVAFVRDITERKRTEASLRITQFSFDHAAMGIYRIAADARILEVNQRAAELIGYSREALATMTIMDIDPMVTEDSWGPIWQQLLDKGMDRLETTHHAKDGRNIPVEIHSNLLEYEGQQYAIAFVQDISERKHAEGELRKLRNYLSNVINSMPSMLVGVDREGRITQWNRQAEQVTGRLSDHVIGKPLDGVFALLADQMGNIETAIHERRVISVPKVTRKAEQETRYEDITIFPLAADGVEGAVVRVDDVTDRVRLEEMMIQSEKMLSVGGLAAGMAHEINNPLAGMLQTANVISNRLTNADLPANRRAAEQAGITMEAIGTFMEIRGIWNMLETISQSGKRAAEIVTNMLSFARKSENIVSSQDIGSLLDRTLDLLKTDYDMKKHYDFKQIRIIREYTPNVPPVPCEASKIQQVFMNILKNGAEAMAEVEAPPAPPSFVLRIATQAKWVKVEIEDNGPGMDEATRRRIFEPFFTTKPIGKGTGLGMSVSYFIVTEDHGGEMSAHAADSGGTCVVIRLPQSGKQPVADD